jgi:hypothetical protein
MKTMATLAIVLLATVPAFGSGFTTYTCRCFADYGLSFEDFGYVTVKVKNGVSEEKTWEYQTQACQQKYNSKAPRAIQCVEL